MPSKWDSVYQQQSGTFPDPCWTLSSYAHLLPMKGDALDLACGLGGNARFLASKGLNVRAWDLSQVAIDALNSDAESNGLPLLAELRNVEQLPPDAHSFDVIVVANFLHRPSISLLESALRAGGLLFYQTHSQVRPEGVGGPSNPDFLLRSNELLEVFGDMRVLAYREDALEGNILEGRRGVASLVACKQTTA